MSDIERRRVLQALGAAGVGATVGPSIVRANDEDDPATPFCEGCPSGTDLLVKYDWDDEDEKFEYDGGSCGDIVEFTDVKTDGDDEPTAVSFNSELLFAGLRVKTGNGKGDACDSVPADEVLDDREEKKTDEGYPGSVSISQLDEVTTISYIAFCAPVCFQVDFVFGDVIPDLGNDDDEDFYGKRKIVHTYGNSYTQRVSGTQSRSETRNGCTVDIEQLAVDFDADTASVSFNVDVDVEEDDCKLTLASYVAPCPTVFDSEVADRQYLLDYDTRRFDEGTGKELSVPIPTAEHLKSICEEDGGTGNYGST